MRTRQQPIKLSEIGIGIPPSSDALWHEPPPRRRPHRNTSYFTIAKELVDRPQEWRIVAVFNGATRAAQNLTSTINRHKGTWGTVGDENDGGFHAVYTDKDENGLRGVYARFVKNS